MLLRPCRVCVRNVRPEWHHTSMDCSRFAFQFHIHPFPYPYSVTCHHCYSSSILDIHVCVKVHAVMLSYSISSFQIIQSADQLSVSNDAVVGLLKGAAEVLSLMPHDKITAGMRGLCQMQVSPLVEVGGEEQQSPPGTPSLSLPLPPANSR